MRLTLPTALLTLFLLSSALSIAQTNQPDMPGMDMSTPAAQTSPTPSIKMNPNMDMSKNMPMGTMKPPTTLIDAELNHTSSGTSIEPASTPASMLMRNDRGWMLMLHGNGFISDIQQHAEPNPTGPSLATCQQFGLPCSTPEHRGSDKLFSTNWIMPMATRQFGPGKLTVRAMFSLEPATISGRQYSELFQQGETAFGTPIIDGQHPHNFFMEVAALYDIRTSEHTLLSFYAAPIGDPAIGPTAYPHRLSALEDPIAALGHHQEDSTHIAYNVLTAGFTWRWLRFEEGGFHGGEPSEQRWGFQPSPNGHAIDSYTSRVTFSPSANWSSQYSIAHITSPEALYPGENQQRQTASIMYNRPFGTTNANGTRSGNWSSTLLWGRTASLSSDSKENSYLAESLVNFHTRNYLWTRIENVGRSNELLIPPGNPLPPNFNELPIGHVQAYTGGYDRDFHIGAHLLAAPGAQFTTYTAPAALISTYGHHPFGAVAFLRIRIVQ